MSTPAEQFPVRGLGFGQLQEPTPQVFTPAWVIAALAVGAWQVAEAADRIELSLAEPGQSLADSAMDALALAAAEARAVVARFDCAA